MQPFPCFLTEMLSHASLPFPLMLIGGPGVGKTAFLNALAGRLPSGRGQLREGMHLESTDLQELSNSTGE